MPPFTRRNPFKPFAQAVFGRLLVLLLGMLAPLGQSVAEVCGPKIFYIKITDVDAYDPTKFLPGTSVQREFLGLETGVIYADGTIGASSTFRRDAAPFEILRGMIDIRYTTRAGDLASIKEQFHKLPWGDCFRVADGSGPARADLPSPLVDNPLSWLGGWPLRDFFDPFEIAKATCTLAEGMVSSLRSDDRTGELVATVSVTGNPERPVYVEFYYHAETWEPHTISRVRIPNEYLGGTEWDVRARTPNLPPPWATHYGCRLTDQNGEPLLNCDLAAGSLLELKPATFPVQPGCDRETTVSQGGRISMRLQAFGREPIQYRWSKDGVAISNGEHFAGAESVELTLLNAREKDAGTYEIEASNQDGPVSTCSIRLRVIVPPRIISQYPPAPLDPSTLCDYSEFVGEPMIFTVEATGTPPLRYQWRKSFGLILDDYRISGSKTDTLTIDWLLISDAGDYDVVVSNEAGETSTKPVSLCILSSVVGPGLVEHPSIKLPTTRPLRVGDGVVLSARVWGSFPLTNRWLKNGRSIGTATVMNDNSSNEVTLALPNAKDSDSGDYSLRVSNLNGSVVSSAVTVDVLTVPKVISLLPASQTKWVGDPASFTVTATGSTPLTYQWFKGGSLLSNGTRTTLANTDTFTLSGVQAADAGSYTVAVSNAAGSDTSAGATLTVLTAVAISQHPQSQVVVAGEQASFSVTATGTPPLAYRWHKAGNPLGNSGRISGTGTANLEISDVQAEDAGDYHVVITGVAGNQRPSNPATLTVILPPVITRQPTSLTVASGRGASFEVIATGTPPLSYRWRKNGVALRNGGDITGVDSPSLRLTDATAADSGRYDVLVSNSAGSTLSDRARLTVEAPCSPQMIGDISVTATSEISGQNRPASKTVNGIHPDPGYWQSVGVGQGFGEDRAPALTFDLKGVHRLDYLLVWNPFEPLAGIKRMAVDASLDGITFLPVALDIVLRNTAEPQRLSFGGLAARVVRFRVLENAVGTVYPISGLPRKSSSVGLDEVEFYGWSPGLIANPITIATHPQSRAADAGQDVQFATEVTGTPQVRYQWLKDGAVMSNGADVFGSDTPTLLLTNVQSEDAGNYELVVNGPECGTVSLPATLTVEDPLVPKQISGITATATSEMTANGRLAANTVNGIYQDSYFWQSVGVGAGFGEDRAPAITFDLKTEYRLDHLLIWNGHERDTEIKRLTIAVSVDGVDFDVLPGEFTLVFDGAAAPQTLPLNGRLARFVRLNILELGSGVRFPLVGAPAGGSLAAIDEVEFYGWSPSGTPGDRPTIRQHPVASERPAGQAAEFVVVATGIAPLSYQWRRNGTVLNDGGNVSGANTATLRLARVQAADAGNYAVVVSNAGGSTPSSAAALTVEPVTILRQPANLIAIAGQTAQFTVTATGTAPLTYQWRKGGAALSDGGAISGANSATLTLSNLQPDDAGSYDVVVINADHSLTSTAVMLAVADAQLYRDLLLHLPFSGNAQDSSGNNRHGQVTGATLTTDRTGAGDSAYAFNGSSSISVANLDPDNYATGFSFGCWIKSGNGGGSPAYWVHDADWGSTYIVLGLPDSVSFRLGSGNPATSYAFNGLNLALNQWHHIFVTHDASFDRLYMNGQKIFERASKPLLGNVPTLELGKEGFQGSIDEFAVFGRGLEPGEVLAIYQIGIAPAVMSAPTITQQPVSTTGATGQAAEFVVAATGTAPLSYQWRRNGTILNHGGNVSGADTATLRLGNVQIGDAGSYDVVVSNAAGSKTSDAATLTVEAGSLVMDDFNDNVRNPSIWAGTDLTEGGASLSETGQRLEYRVAIPDSAGVDEAYRRLAGSIAVPADHDWEVAVDLANSAVAGNGNWASVGLSLLSPDESRNVFLELYVEGSARGFVTGLDADGDPVGTDGDTGNLGLIAGSVRLVFNRTSKVVSAFYDADGPVNGFQWVHLASYGLAGAGGSSGNDNWQLGPGDTLVLAVGGYSEGVTVTAGQAYLDNFTFSKESSGEAPTITSSPQSLTVVSGQAAHFTVAATGTPPLSYQWRKGGVPLNNGGDVSGANSATLTLANVQAGDAGSYDVMVSNTAGNKTSAPATLTVEVSAVPRWLTGLTVTATSELVSHARTVAGLTDGTFAEDGTATGLGSVWESSGIGFGSPQDDRAPAITFALGGLFRVQMIRLWNFPEASVAIRRVAIEISADGTQFTFSQEAGEIAQVGQHDIALTAPAARFLRLRILENWGGDQYPLEPGTPIKGFAGFVGLQEARLYAMPDSGGSDVAPAITQPPVNVTVTAGEAAQFTVTATGTAPLSYQWRKGGNPLSNGGNVSGVDTATLTLANVQSADAGSYDVVVSNAAGSKPSDPATLTVEPPLVAPLITQQPAPATVFAGQDATFTVMATGSAPLAYQWFFTPAFGGEQALTSSTAATLTLAAATAGQAGSYRVNVANAANPAGVFSTPATLTVNPVTGGFVNRRLPGAYGPGKPFEVTLETRPASTVAFYAVADTPPMGWTVSGINEGGLFDPRTGEVKFGLFADNAPRTLRYTVLPPATANGRFEFSGIASADGVESSIGGTGSIENSVSHPADVNSDLRLAINEATGYGAAWKRGESWTLPPNPVPVNYVTRAGFLWRNGELYHLDPIVGGAPLWWVPKAGVTPNGSLGVRKLHTPTTATRTFAGKAAKLAVTPAEEVSVYAVEERLFAGFIATDISQGGVFLPAEGLIRWGPFFDHEAREFAYAVSAPANFEGEIAVLGLVSEDGNSFPVTGDSVLRFGTTEPPPPVTPGFSGDSFRLDMAGPLNARVIIEIADALGGTWDLATEFELNKPEQSWSVPVEIQESGRFFRVRVVVP